MSSSALDASVTLEEVLAVVAARRVPLAPELAGYLVLEIAEHADPEGGGVDPKSVFVGEEGTVALVKVKRDGTPGNAEVSIRVALGRLLEASGSHTPALAAASKRKNGAGLAAFAAEVEAALIPVNRAAGRRALARLAREVKRVTLGVGRHTLPSSSSFRLGGDGAPASSRIARDEDPAVPATRVDDDLKHAPLKSSSEVPRVEAATDVRPILSSHGNVDALIARFGVSGGNEQQQARALKAMAGLDPTPAAPPEVAKLPRESLAQTRFTTQSHDARESVGAAPPSRGRFADGRPLTTTASHPVNNEKGRTLVPSGAFPRRRVVIVLALAAISAVSYAAWQLRPAGTLRSGSNVVEPTTVQPTATQAACVGTILVADVPPHAEVLIHEGQAPVDVQRMPVGTRLEFIATAEGYAPKRVVVPTGAGWDTGADGKPRFEAAVQLETSRARMGATDAWPAGDPGSAVGGEGPPGTVHVVATPRGAEIWMLAGIGPEARIEHLRCDQDVDLLLAGPTTYRKRLRVRVVDFLPDDALRAALAKAPMRIARVSAR